MHRGYWILLLLALWGLGACSGEPDTGPGKIRWDRETCQRCAMALSERHYAAQIRGGPRGQKRKLYKFDDIGCAIIWLDQQPWNDTPDIEIWVADYQSGDWLDARKAWYVTGQHTPMGYGLGATAERVPGALNFEQARTHVYRIEEQIHNPRGHVHSPSQAGVETP